MEIKNETINQVTAYLATRPWREVEPLMHEISNQVAVDQAKQADAQRAQIIKEAEAKKEVEKKK